MFHEQKHREDWQLFYGEELATAITCSESLQSDIDCDEPNTTTCQAAENHWKPWIRRFFRLAWDYALNSFDDQSTPNLDESEVRAYEVEYLLEHYISAALPEGCGG